VKVINANSFQNKPKSERLESIPIPRSVSQKCWVLSYITFH